MVDMTYNVGEKLDQVRIACGYATDAELARGLGVSEQVLSNWRTRNTYGRGGDALLHDTTAASIDWLRGRGKVPFPNGPKLNQQQDVPRLIGDVDQLRKALLEFAYALAESRRDVALAWKARLENAASPYYIERGFHGLLLGVLDTLSESQAKVPGVPRPPEVHAKARRKAGK
jgi:hypothetical protein